MAVFLACSTQHESSMVMVRMSLTNPSIGDYFASIFSDILSALTIVYKSYG